MCATARRRVRVSRCGEHTARTRAPKAGERRAESRLIETERGTDTASSSFRMLAEAAVLGPHV
jgi:hypothetical protein